MHAHEPGKLEKKAFYSALIVAFTFMIVEIIGGIASDSLALISDALHMFSDVGALLLGIFVLSLSLKPANEKKTFGYARAEVLGALASGAILWILMIFLVYEGILRLFNPPEVKGDVVFIIASIGLLANIVMMKLLHPRKGGNLNIRAAYLHVLGDLFGSIGVIISGAVIWGTGWDPIDPIITFFIAALIFYSSGKMIFEAIQILMEGTPKSISLQEIKKQLLSIEGVKEVHDLHVWNLSPKKTVLSAHIIAEDHQQKVLNQVHETIKNSFQIPHMTIQIEDPKHFQAQYCFDCQKES